MVHTRVRHGKDAGHSAYRGSTDGATGSTRRSTPREEAAMAKNISVCLTFDFDAMSVWIGTFNTRSPSALSRGEFGNIGAQRLLAMLHEWGIRSTWFVPGHTADAFPDTVKKIGAAGHEIGHHGYFHQRHPTPEAEASNFDRSPATLKRVFAIKPVAYRSPATALITSTPNL